VQGYALAGVEYGSQCYCGGNPWDSDNVYRLGPSVNCFTRCKGDRDTFCGGPWALSVYLTGNLDGYFEWEPIDYLKNSLYGQFFTCVPH
jgi:hypothetical protein